ncbi:glycosyltransferase [Siccirubricoccus sp. G192]|uniref:glycosyltransferase n=1 Tax=Siccirubricoccus sp. G192 TaxID=2849651 RepID=UPI001C2CACD5|nr:glycosyltransferase [Siccirubricoccus sp. G192]MBV1797730.1 glycosyltransferase [Siccirubricoccus sp. G192]
MTGALPTGRVDVVNAYRALLGREPESDAVIAENLPRPVPEIVAALARSGEFDAVLATLASGALPPHAGLTEAARQEAWDWASRQDLLRATPGLPRSAGTLPGALLHAAPVAAAIARQPESRQEVLRGFRDRPERCPAHLLTLPAEARDRLWLGRLLHGETADAGPAETPAGTLLQFLAAEIATPRFRAEVLRPVIEGGWLPACRLPAAALAGCAAWLEDRLGVRPDATGFYGTLLAALLTQPALAPLIEASHPAEHAPLLEALPDLASGLLHLRAARVGGEDVAMAYLAVLGREAESEAVRRSHAGAPLWTLIATLFGSEEFRTQTLHRLIGGGDSPHFHLPLELRRQAGAWLEERLALPLQGVAPLHPAALLLRLVSLPAIAAELQRAHDVLWQDARAALAALHAAASQGATGAIDYVTGDVVAGWALDRESAEPIEIEIHCNGELVGFGRADRPRAEAAEAGAERAGFRIPWRGRSRMRPAEGFRFQIIAARSGQPVGPAFLLDAVFTDARSSMQRMAAELAEMRGTLRRLEAMLPQLESFAAWPPDLYAAFRRQHAVPPPPRLPAQPLAVRLVLDCDAVSTKGLRRTLDSLTGQLWPHWTAVLLTGSAERQALLAQAAARDPRFLPWPLAAGEAMAAAERRAAAAGEEPLVLLAPPGSVFAEAALSWFVHAASTGAAGFYCDEDALTEPVRHVDRHEAPVFRACFDEWTLPFRNPCGELVCARREALLAAWQAVPPDSAGLAERRWLLAAALARAGVVAHVPRVLFSVQRDEVAEAPSGATPAALRPLLRRPWLLDAPREGPGGRITAIVPTRNGGALLRGALSSLVEKAAEPGRIGLLVVDNGSDDAATLEFLAEGRAAGRFAVLRVEEPFNWSRLNNLAAREARDGALLFLNDDTRMLTPGWDRLLERLLAEPEVGAVGARLVYEDLTLQHAGVVMGAERLAAHEGVGAPMQEPGPLGRWQSLRAVGAVTGAFLACRQESFARVGGFDEHGLGITFNDVDFCLKLRAAGLRVLYEPGIALVHFESKSRGLDDQDAGKKERAEFEARKLAERWGEGLLRDPGFNPHWSRWTRPFAAIREPSAAEIEAHLVGCAAVDPWSWDL